MDAADARALKIVFPAQMGAENWAREDRPDLWPYGLNHLAEARGKPASLEPLSKASPRTLLAGIAGLGAKAPGRGTRSDGIDYLTWDEFTGATLAATRLEENDRLYSGLIWATDTPADVKTSLQRRFTHTHLRRASALWCLSKPQVHRAEKWLGARRPPIEFVPFGIDAEFFQPTPFRSEKLVVSIGNDRDRDIRTLYEAWDAVGKHVAGSRLFVQTPVDAQAPDGVTRIEKMSHSDLRRVYSNADVVAVATRPNWHVSGMTVALEAAASARPVVMTGTPGADDYVEHGRTGFLSEQGSPESLAKHLRSLLESPAEAEAMGLAGRSKVEREHRSTHLSERLHQLIADHP